MICWGLILVERICILFAGDSLYPPGTSYYDLVCHKRKRARKSRRGSDKDCDTSNHSAANGGT